MVDSDGNNGAEKRRHRRSPLMLKVRYAHAQDFLADYTENISAGGVFIATDEHFEKDALVDFEISFPGLLDPIQIKGEVKWYRPPGAGDERPGIGVQFLNEFPGRGPVSTLVSRLNQSDAPPAPTGEEIVFRVLLVEDNVVVRDMFRYGIQKLTKGKKLSGSRLEVVEADNGKQAWDLLQQKDFHLLIIDLYMPVMDGKQLIQHVSRNPKTKNIPIVVVSSGGNEDREQALRSGADIYLSKPIILKQMVETIETLISTGFIPKS